LIIEKIGRRASLRWGGGLPARLVQFAAIDANEMAAPRPLLGGGGCANGASLSVPSQPNKAVGADGPSKIFGARLGFDCRPLAAAQQRR